jgi:hypothetical protein
MSSNDNAGVQPHISYTWNDVLDWELEAKQKEAESAVEVEEEKKYLKAENKQQENVIDTNLDDVLTETVAEFQIEIKQEVIEYPK